MSEIGYDCLVFISVISYNLPNIIPLLLLLLPDIPDILDNSINLQYFFANTSNMFTIILYSFLYTN